MGIGAVIMPWMLAYQQSACALERNSVEELQDRRFETKIGSFITQGGMSAVLIMGAAVPGTKSIKNVEDLAALCRTICGSAAVAVVAIGGNDNTGVLDVATQILNGILMIPIVGVLWYLTAFHLPECPLVGVRKWVTGISFFVCCVFSVVGLLTQGGSSRM